MSRPPGSDGAQTRERILEVAQQLFTREGYEATSLRDIADQLGITKAALYYHFARKDAILLALHERLELVGESLVEEFERTPEGPERVVAWDRLADRLIAFMVENRELILLHNRNRNAFERLEAAHGAGERDVEMRFQRALASPAISLRDRVRMAATIGVITEVFSESAHVFENEPPEAVAALVREIVSELSSSGSPQPTAPDRPESSTSPAAHAQPI